MEDDKVSILIRPFSPHGSEHLVYQTPQEAGNPANSHQHFQWMTDDKLNIYNK
jgi:hypothetical protein